MSRRVNRQLLPERPNMKRLGMIFIKNLKEYRKKCGFTQSQLAEKVNVTPHYIGMLEMGRNFPATDLIERIAKALNIEMYELFVESLSPSKELEKLRNDIMLEIKKTITETVIQTVREAFEENIKYYSQKGK
jgi:transcriptional regulator with XRE-family HTH domain